MLSILGDGGSGRHARLCDGISRRDLLRLGTLTVGGLSLPQLLKAEQAVGIRNSHKAVIMIYMCGAPGHQDMYDLKMDAPAEIRGEFKPIHTNVPGIDICEHMPRLAAIMDKCVPLRSMHGSPDGNHDSFICYTGRTVRNQPSGGWPSMGASAPKFSGQWTKPCQRLLVFHRMPDIRPMVHRGILDFSAYPMRHFVRADHPTWILR